MSLYNVGLDTHLKTSTVVILDPHGKEVESRTIRGHWTEAVDWLRSRGLPMAVCFEASCGYGSLHDALSRFARRVVVAHPGRLRLIFRSKRKNDRVDAQKLATLLFLDQVPAVHVPTVEGRSWRELIEFRRRQIDGRVRVKNQIRALLRSHGVVAPREVRSLWSKAGRAWLASSTWATDGARLRRDLLLLQLRQADEAARVVTKQLDAIAQRHAGVTLLRTIPGVGPRTAESFVAYVDDPHRFARVNRIGSYFGLVPCQDSSAAVNRLGHITKEGPATARKLMVESAWRCIDHSPGMRAFFERVAGGKPDRRKVALIAVAHKLLRVMLSMLKSGAVWDEAQANSHEKEAAMAAEEEGRGPSKDGWLSRRRTGQSGRTPLGAMRPQGPRTREWGRPPNKAEWRSPKAGDAG